MRYTTIWLYVRHGRFMGLLRLLCFGLWSWQGIFCHFHEVGNTIDNGSRVCVGRFINQKIFSMISEEMLENLILGHIARELKDEIQIGRQVNLAKTIMQALRIHDVSGRHLWLDPYDLEFAKALQEENRLEAVKWLAEKAKGHSLTPLKDAKEILDAYR